MKRSEVQCVAPFAFQHPLVLLQLLSKTETLPINWLSCPQGKMRFDRWQARHLPRSHGHGEKSSAAHSTSCLQLSGPLHFMGEDGNAHGLSGDCAE